MRIRSWLFIAILFSSFCFSGCFEIFYDVVQHPDGTFIIRQTIGFTQEFFEGITSIAPTSDSTHSQMTTAMLVDSMRHIFGHLRDSLVDQAHIIGTSGITRLTTRDTMINTLTYYTLEATVSNLDSIPAAFHVLGASESLSPGSQADSSKEVLLKVEHAKGLSTLTFYVPPSDNGFMQMDVPGLEESFSSLSMHYRVISPNLERSKDKLINQIPGGQERVLHAKELFKKGRAAHLDAAFVIKQ